VPSEGPAGRRVIVGRNGPVHHASPLASRGAAMRSRRRSVPGVAQRAKTGYPTVHLWLRVAQPCETEGEACPGVAQRAKTGYPTVHLWLRVAQPCETEGEACPGVAQRAKTGYPTVHLRLRVAQPCETEGEACPA
jgi:hypothetical protein